MSLGTENVVVLRYVNQCSLTIHFLVLQLEEFKKINPEAFSRQTIDGESPKDESAESVQG